MIRPYFILLIGLLLGLACGPGDQAATTEPSPDTLPPLEKAVQLDQDSAPTTRRMSTEVVKELTAQDSAALRLDTINDQYDK